MIHNVVVVGLGLMGGSMAKAVRAYTDCKVYGWNRTRAVAGGSDCRRDAGWLC